MRTARPLYKYLQASRLRSKRAFLDNLLYKIEIQNINPEPLTKDSTNLLDDNFWNQ